MFSNPKDMSSIITTAAEYVTDVMWYPTECHASLVSSLTQLGVEDLSYYPTERRIDTLSLAYTTGVRDVSKEQIDKQYRWYSKPMKKLSTWIKLICNGAEESSLAYSALGSELFPIKFRMGYAGKWIINSSQGISRTSPMAIKQEVIELEYKGFGTHNLHPMYVTPDSYDMSVVQCTDEVTWSNYTVTRPRGSKSQFHIYTDAKKLCKVISLNYNRLQ